MFFGLAALSNTNRILVLLESRFWEVLGATRRKKLLFTEVDRLGYSNQTKITNRWDGAMSIMLILYVFQTFRVPLERNKVLQ